ncbi:MAG TPA: acetyl-coenzyme A synthetase, partial [Chromatiaceae bacterium]|nr:acetyl-coenzyme A synthetase [Chromatiaceae bacterium]
MSEDTLYPVPQAFAAQANVTAEQYEQLYRQSIEDPEGFWAGQASNYLHWFKTWDKVLDWSYEGDIHIRWFEGGKLNACYNCLDR